MNATELKDKMGIVMPKLLTVTGKSGMRYCLEADYNADGSLSDKFKKQREELQGNPKSGKA